MCQSTHDVIVPRIWFCFLFHHIRRQRRGVVAAFPAQTWQGNMLDRQNRSPGEIYEFLLPKTGTCLYMRFFFQQQYHFHEHHGLMEPIRPKNHWYICTRSISGTISVCLQFGSEVATLGLPKRGHVVSFGAFLHCLAILYTKLRAVLWLARLFVSIFLRLCFENHHNSKAVLLNQELAFQGPTILSVKQIHWRKNVGLATSLTVGPHFVKHVFVVGFGKQTASETRNSCENTNHPKCWVSMAGMLGLFFQNHENLGKPTKRKVDT